MNLIFVIRKLVKNLNVYVGFSCYIMFNKREVYGPFKPTLASGSDNTMPSCHAEVNAIKHILTIKNKKCLSKATIIVIRWSYNKILDDWILQNAIPCYDCIKYLQKFNIKNYIISTDTKEQFKKVTFDFMVQNTKKSTGRLFGK